MVRKSLFYKIQFAKKINKLLALTRVNLALKGYSLTRINQKFMNIVVLIEMVTRRFQMEAGFTSTP